MLEVFLDALLDSLKVLAFVFVIHVILSFVEEKIAKLLEKKHRFAPLLGSLFGLVPQCGVSVVAADMYLRRHITMGTVVAVFIACSDEALPILFSNFSGNWWIGFVVLGAKMVFGFAIGFLVDLLFSRQRHEAEEHHEHCEGEESVHIGCCHHEIEGEKENKWKEHLVHPLLHSLKIWAYVFVITFAFGTLIYYVKEENISSFLEANKYLSPLVSVLIGLIPNCASSVIISEAYTGGMIPLSALVGGLMVNAGLGMVVLYKSKEHLKEALIILTILIVSSLAVGYGFIWLSL